MKACRTIRYRLHPHTHENAVKLHGLAFGNGAATRGDGRTSGSVKSEMDTAGLH